MPRVATEDAARRWRDVWQQGWTDHDPDTILTLYSEEAELRSHPYREQQAPAGYIVPTFAAERSTTCWFGEPIVQGDRAAVEWTAETHLLAGGVERLAGVSLLRFNPDGQVVEHRDIWTTPED